MASITYDLTVGQSYPVSNGVQSASFEFLGLVGSGHKRVLLFNNPNQIGVPYLYIGAQPEIIWPTESLATVSVTIRLRARYVGNSPTSLTPYARESEPWGNLGGGQLD